MSRTLREQLRGHLEFGCTPLRARLALLDALAVRAGRELEHVWRSWSGELRRRKEDEVLAYWREFWTLLWQRLGAFEEAEAVELLDGAIDRVEPAGAAHATGRPDSGSSG